MLFIGFIVLLFATGALWHHGLWEALHKMRLSAPAARRYRQRIAWAAGGWLAYVAALAYSHLLTDLASPLRIPVLVLLPVAAFAVYCFASPHMRAVGQHFPKPMPVFGQTLRVAIELLVYGSYVQGIIPGHATFEGYNLSIVVGLTAPVVGFMAFLSRSLPARMLLAWNAAGLLLAGIEMYLFVSILVCPEWCGTDRPFSPAIGTMPYLLLLAVFLPSAAFLHGLSIVQTLAHAKRRPSRPEYA